ncbi:MAG: hypothetical protein H6839_01000 [Planctomycetes bacterium]|nr:hypothetical protein [Planctomycetota bacterium]
MSALRAVMLAILACTASPATCATFIVGASDTTGLISAINTANGNGATSTRGLGSFRNLLLLGLLCALAVAGRTGVGRRAR